MQKDRKLGQLSRYSDQVKGRTTVEPKFQSWARQETTSFQAPRPAVEPTEAPNQWNWEVFQRG